MKMRPTLRCLLCRGFVLKEEGLIRYKDHLSQEHNIEFFLDWIVDKTIVENAKSSDCQPKNPQIVITDECEADTLVEIHPPAKAEEIGKNRSRVPSPEVHSPAKSEETGKNQPRVLSPRERNQSRVLSPKNQPRLLSPRFLSPRERRLKNTLLSSVEKSKLSPSAKKLKVKVGKKTLNFNTKYKFNVKTEGHITTKHLEEARQKMRKTAFATVPPRVQWGDHQWVNDRRKSIMAIRSDRRKSLLAVRDKKFDCEDCGMSFVNRLDLKKHTATHSTKTFKCDQCEEHFEYKVFLVKHKRIFHPNFRQLKTTNGAQSTTMEN